MLYVVPTMNLEIHGIKKSRGTRDDTLAYWSREGVHQISLHSIQGIRSLLTVFDKRLAADHSPVKEPVRFATTSQVKRQQPRKISAKVSQPGIRSTQARLVEHFHHLVHE